MPKTHANQQLLTQFLEEVWNNGDVEACRRYIAQKYTIRHDPGDPWDQRALTSAQFQERVRLSRAPFPDQRFEVLEMLGDEHKVMITWLWSATHKGDIPGFPATGRTIRMSGATVYYFDAGLISGHWQITDRLGVYSQLQRALSNAETIIKGAHE